MTNRICFGRQKFGKVETLRVFKKSYFGVQHCVLEWELLYIAYPGDIEFNFVYPCSRLPRYLWIVLQVDCPAWFCNREIIGKWSLKEKFANEYTTYFLHVPHVLQSDGRLIGLLLPIEIDLLELIRNSFRLPENQIRMSLTPRSDRGLERWFVASLHGNSHRIDRFILP